jgi:hypothetical protein
MAIPGVTGTGEGKRGTQVILVVYVGRTTPELRKRIPDEIEGYPSRCERWEYRAPAVRPGHVRPLLISFPHT